MPSGKASPDGTSGATTVSEGGLKGGKVECRRGAGE